VQGLIFEVTYDKRAVWAYNITMEKTPNPIFARAMKYPKFYLHPGVLKKMKAMK